MTALVWTVPSWTTVSKKCWRVAPVALHAYRKDAHVRATNTTTASMLDSRMVKCLRETLTLLTMAAQSAPVLQEGAGSAAASSAVLIYHQTASMFQSLETVACSVNV